jgi:hypothetical protein
VAPWHPDEHLPAPTCIAETVSPSLSAAGQLDRMRLLYQAMAGATARASNPLLLTGDCTAALGPAGAHQVGTMPLCQIATSSLPSMRCLPKASSLRLSGAQDGQF